MVSKVKKALSRIKKRGGDESGEDGGIAADANLWSTDLQKHAYGDFSLAVAQANVELQDYSQVEARPDLTFVGVYDGDCGDRCSRFLFDNVFNILIEKYDQQEMSSELLKEAISETESLFMEHVRDTFGGHPAIGGTGSSCLIGVLKGQYLYVGNIGDSRAVKGVLGKPNKMLTALMGGSVRPHKIRAQEITKEHNVNIKEVRKEVQLEHADDADILVRSEGIWLIKGITQLSRGLGHASLKHPEFAYGPHQNKSISRAVIRSDPDVFNGILIKSDQFLIFASRGFWEHMTNEEAVDTVCRHPHNGIARRLVIKAMQKAGRKKEKGYEELKEMELPKLNTTWNNFKISLSYHNN